MARQHPDVEFHVDVPTGTRVFRNFVEAAGVATRNAHLHGRGFNLDVVCTSAAGASWWGGEHSRQSYLEDQDASVLERLVVTVESRGRVA